MKVNIIGILKQRKAQATEYYVKGQADIAKTNTATLVFSGIGLLFITILLYLVSFFMFPGWKPRWTHNGLLIIGLASIFIGLLLQKKKVTSFYLVLFCSLLFQYGVMFMIISMGTFVYWDCPSTFITLVLIVLPVMFIIPETIMIPSVIIWETTFVVLTYQTKIVSAIEFDVFSSIAAAIGSIILLVITSQLRVKEYLSKREYMDLSVVDVLTGIWNKAACAQKADEYLKNRGKEPFVFMVIDIDHFKEINDTRGHGTGDKVLKLAGDVLRDTFREMDIYGRFGGDEFTILMRNIGDKDLVEERILQFKNKFKRLVKISLDYSTNVSVGTIMIDEQDQLVTYEELFHMADVILYSVKKNGMSRHAILNKEEYNNIACTQKWMLVADADLDTQKIFTNAFKDEYELIFANDGEEAKKWITYYRDRLSIVLLDLSKPRMKGYQVLQWLNEHEELKNIAVVAMNTIEEEKSRIEQVGGAALIQKPFDLLYLKNKIDRLIVAMKEKESAEWI
jgi:diguanylate cyclase (GGDEF)-like protein